VEYIAVDTLRMVAVRTGVVICVVIGLTLDDRARAQLLDRVLPHADESALICKAGAMLGGGGQENPAEAIPNPIHEPHRQQVLFEIVTRVDLNRDQQLDHRELRALDYQSRQQMLQELDTNHDRKLSAKELEVATLAPSQGGYPYPEQSIAEAPKQPETFRNLRRYGIGIQQTPPKPRSQPFARAATFGTSPNFTRPVTKQSIDRRAGGSCRPTSTFWLRVGRPR